jgi:hypothetical protein
MKARIRGRATYADLEKVPENMVAELIDGDLYAWPRPAGPHARVASTLGMDIGTCRPLRLSDCASCYRPEEKQPRVRFRQREISRSARLAHGFKIFA